MTLPINLPNRPTPGLARLREVLARDRAAARRYVVAVAVTGVAVSSVLAIEHLLHLRSNLLLVPAVIISAWYGGRGPGALRTIRAATSRRVGSLVALLAPAVVATSTGAQETPIGVELRPLVGAYLPTGRHADLLRTGALVGFQGARAVNHYLSVVGTVAWLPNEDKTTSVDATVDLYVYDLGAEVATSKSLWTGAVLRPSVGLGIGGRSFGYRERDPLPQHALTAYAALGGQLRLVRVGGRRVDFRVEARGYVTGFKGLTGELARTETRSDVTIATGLAVAL